MELFNDDNKPKKKLKSINKRIDKQIAKQYKRRSSAMIKDFFDVRIEEIAAELNINKE